MSTNDPRYRSDDPDRSGGAHPAGARDANDTHDADRYATTVPTEAAVLDRERAAYGGVKVGSAFFGWLTASGVTVLLLALLAAAGAAVGLSQATDVTATDVDPQTAQTVGIVSGIILLVVLFIAYFCGGYVAGRMARFDGRKQGLAVWLWALAIAVLIAILGAIAGTQFDVLAQLNAFPRIPINEGDLTTGGIIAAVLALLVTLGGAVLGGAAGTRYHRKVDHEGFAAGEPRRR